MIGRYTAGLLLLAVVLGPGLPDVQAARDVAEQRECATCHIMWLKAFKREDVSTLIPYDPRPMEESGRTDVTSTSLMCLSCHDGFVLDSRSLWKDGHQGHPVGIEPPQAIAQQRVDGKNLFPLNDDGKIYCGTCHTAHGVDWEASDTPVFMRARSTDGELCQGCHADRQEGPASGNHPVNVEVGQVPTVAGTQHLTLSSDGKVTCQSCHTAHNAPADKLLVVANENSQLCGACHEDQDVATLQMAAGAGTHPVNIVPLRAQVPNELFEHGGRLGDDGQVICQSCHMPHQAQSDEGILIMANQDSGLCRACHQDESRVVGSRHDLSLTANQTTTADSKDVCSTCHVAHGGSGPKMWAREIPSGTDPMSGLCLGCHATGGSAESHLVGRNSHPVGVNLATPGQLAGLPTFSAQGVRADAGDIGMVSCASCHDPHQWDPDHPGIAAEPGVDGDAGNSFLRLANDHDSVLCRECHEGKWQLAGTSHDLSMSLPGSVNAAGVVAGEAGMCGSCHRTHNGLGPAMWARDIPDGRAPVTVACLSCHGEQGPADARPADEFSHPVGVSIDTLDIAVEAHGWRTEAPGIGAGGILEPLPLYNDHGDAAPDGDIIGCGSCHDPHRRSPAGTPAPDAPAGEAGIAGDETGAFLRLADRGRDALCINCHAAKDTVRFSPHGRTELPEHAATEETAGQDVCLSCHRAHEGEAAYMWARAKGPGTQLVEQLCTSCHRNGGDANDRLTGENSHPLGLSLDEGGVIDCASCHDPHQWNPNDPLSREGLADGVEGNITTSFLKIGDTNGGVCIQCHEESADVLGTDHDLRITAIDATNLVGQSVAEAGLCGQCHAVHKARLEHALWAREPGEGELQGDRLCRGCHSRTGVAKAKVPAETEHPKHVTAWPAAAREGPHPEGADGISVLHAETGSGKLGEIGCASCHNPHQWMPGEGVTTAGRNLEGDVQSSFLRLQSTRGFLCADCHGKDALFRYLYFHSSRSRSRN